MIRLRLPEIDNCQLFDRIVAKKHSVERDTLSAVADKVLLLTHNVQK